MITAEEIVNNKINCNVYDGDNNQKIVNHFVFENRKTFKITTKRGFVIHGSDTHRIYDKNKNWEINKGQYVKSFGTTKVLKNTDKEKQTYLILVNGNGVLMNDVTLYKDEVDDCGCDGNPIAKPTDMDKVNEVKPIHNKLNEESAYINKTSKFDKSGMYGLVIGGISLGLIVWFKTKDCPSTIPIVGSMSFYQPKTIASVTPIDSSASLPFNPSTVNISSPTSIPNSPQTTVEQLPVQGLW
jgi:hypothetical protein